MPTKRPSIGGQDRYPSPLLQSIPVLLQRGFSVHDISEVSGVPQALVELIAQQQPAPATPPAALPQTTSSYRRTIWSRRVRRAAIAVIILSAANVCLTVAALIWYLPAFAAWGTGGALTLVAATFLLARRVSPPPPRLDRRR